MIDVLLQFCVNALEPQLPSTLADRSLGFASSVLFAVVDHRK